ncbi:glucosaminidase domain-containing protein [Geoalkalibacter ferrihydriticus]|uniref:glucosaminidase domain-containing protein n=1 Tax=Geoalkalibacter ferrihydriticus TaxID=392333 RepID=UPI001379347E|nr:glucosaminidase domain-containing protein [Geoalkalibacter ferrihydriticus]
MAGLMVLVLLGCQDSGPPPPTNGGQPDVVVVAPDGHAELSRLFALNDYDLDNLDQGVPKLIVTSLPQDLDRVSQVNERKRIFFLTLLPMILMGNEEIQSERDLVEFLISGFDKGRLPTEEEAERLAEIQDKYRVAGDPFSDCEVRTRLLKRVDVLPPSLVLAQAANESGWGTSRFAQVANNLFGEWTFTPGTGIVPTDRPAGEIYEVRSFPTIYDSLRSYMLNLNTHRAYAPLREKRHQARLENRPLKGVDLAQGLQAYSIRGEEYVEEIAAMIRHNQLTRFSYLNLRGL